MQTWRNHAGAGIDARGCMLVAGQRRPQWRCPAPSIWTGLTSRGLISCPRGTTLLLQHCCAENAFCSRRSVPRCADGRARSCRGWTICTASSRRWCTATCAATRSTSMATAGRSRSATWAWPRCCRGALPPPPVRHAALSLAPSLPDSSAFSRPWAEASQQTGQPRRAATEAAAPGHAPAAQRAGLLTVQLPAADSSLCAPARSA